MTINLLRKKSLLALGFSLSLSYLVGSETRATLKEESFLSVKLSKQGDDASLDKDLSNHLKELSFKTPNEDNEKEIFTFLKRFEGFSLDKACEGEILNLRINQNIAQPPVTSLTKEMVEELKKLSYPLSLEIPHTFITNEEEPLLAEIVKNCHLKKVSTLFSNTGVIIPLLAESIAIEEVSILFDRTITFESFKILAGIPSLKSVTVGHIPVSQGVIDCFIENKWKVSDKRFADNSGSLTFFK